MIVIDVLLHHLVQRIENFDSKIYFRNFGDKDIYFLMIFFRFILLVYELQTFVDNQSYFQKMLQFILVIIILTLGDTDMIFRAYFIFFYIYIFFQPKFRLQNFFWIYFFTFFHFFRLKFRLQNFFSFFKIFHVVAFYPNKIMLKHIKLDVLLHSLLILEIYFSFFPLFFTLYPIFLFFYLFFIYFSYIFFSFFQKIST